MTVTHSTDVVEVRAAIVALLICRWMAAHPDERMPEWMREIKGRAIPWGSVYYTVHVEAWKLRMLDDHLADTHPGAAWCLTQALAYQPFARFDEGLLQPWPNTGSLAASA